MATRPVFLPCGEEDQILVREELVDFRWYPGFSREQKQRSIASLHDAARERGVVPVLEISTKSADALGRAFSAFNLHFDHGQGLVSSVEAAFQGSKVFEKGGPFIDIYCAHARSAKKDPRLVESGRLVAFDLHGTRWPLKPRTAFYDWLYVKALSANPDANLLQGYKGFTDIEFNPAKSLNCQARAAALFVALGSRGLLAPRALDPGCFLELMILSDHGCRVAQQTLDPGSRRGGETRQAGVNGMT